LWYISRDHVKLVDQNIELEVIGHYYDIERTLFGKGPHKAMCSSSSLNQDRNTDQVRHLKLYYKSDHNHCLSAFQKICGDMKKLNYTGPAPL
jgi:hypothetical protein